MKILIRCTSTGRFYTPEGNWTDEMAGARVFPGIVQAQGVARTMPDADLEFLIVVLGEPDATTGLTEDWPEKLVEALN